MSFYGHSECKTREASHAAHELLAEECSDDFDASNLERHKMDPNYLTEYRWYFDPSNTAEDYGDRLI